MLYKRGNVYWMGFRFGGRRFRESCDTSSVTLARDIERKRRYDLAAGLHGIKKPATPTTFLVASKDYLKWKKPSLGAGSYVVEEYSLKHLTPVFGGLLVTDITADDITDYQKGRLAESASPKTINMEVATLRQILKKHRLWANIQPDVRMLSVKTDIGCVLTTAEEDALLKACGESRSRLLLPYVVLAINTGMRFGEIRLLKWSQVDLIGATVTVGESKTDAGSGRKVPLNARALKALQTWATSFPDRKPHHYVFPSEGAGLATDEAVVNTHHTKPTVPIGDVQRAWERARRVAEVTVRFHDLRHTACTRMLEAGTPLMVVGQLLGWTAGTVAAMAKRYGHVGPKALRDAVGALDRALAPAPPEQKPSEAPMPATVN